MIVCVGNNNNNYYYFTSKLHNSIEMENIEKIIVIIIYVLVLFRSLEFMVIKGFRGIFPFIGIMF